MLLTVNDVPEQISALDVCSAAAIFKSRVLTGYIPFVVAVDDAGQFYQFTLPVDHVTPSTAEALNITYVEWAAALGGLLVMSSEYGRSTDDAAPDPEE